MARTLDDFYREVLWRTNLTTSDLPYVYASGGNYGFLQLFGDIYKYLVQTIVNTDQNFFLNRSYDSLVANQEIYFLPNDLLRLRHIEFAFDGVSWYPGFETDPVFFKRGAEQTVVSAASMAHPFFWLGDSITAPSSPYHIAPRPATGYTNSILLYYDQMPSGLLANHISAATSAASAKVIFPGEYEYLIPLGVSIEIWGKYGVREQKADEIQRYQKAINDMKNFIKPRASVGQKRVRDSRELNLRDI